MDLLGGMPPDMASSEDSDSGGVAVEGTDADIEVTVADMGATSERNNEEQVSS